MMQPMPTGSFSNAFLLFTSFGLFDSSWELAFLPAAQTQIDYDELNGSASISQLVEHALRKRTVVGSIPTGGFFNMLFGFARLTSSASGRKLYINFAILQIFGKGQFARMVRGWT